MGSMLSLLIFPKRVEEGLQTLLPQAKKVWSKIFQKWCSAAGFGTGFLVLWNDFPSILGAL